MARLSPTTIRARVASTIAAALTGWTESRYAPPTFGRDTASILHQSYSVETPTTTSQGVDRQQPRHDRNTRSCPRPPPRSAPGAD